MTAIISQPLNPQVVYVQTTTPTDLTEGKLWYNTTADTLYVSDGSSYAIMTTDLSLIQRQLLETDINVLINSVASSSTLNDWEDMFVDKFTDTTGYLNTIDTGNTTAVFDTNLYNNTTIGADVNDAHGYDLTGSTANDTTKMGMKINTNATLNLATATKHASDTSTKCYLYSESAGTIGSVLSTQDFSTNTATFNYQLEDNTNYYIVVDNAGAQYNSQHKTSGVSYPQNETNINYIAGLANDTTDLSSQARSILSVKTNTKTNSDLILQTNAITVTTGATHIQLFSHNTLAGTGAITYDISLDNGSTFTTGLALNTKNAITSTTGTQMILKLNLSGVGDGNTASADDYGVMLFY